MTNASATGGYQQQDAPQGTDNSRAESADPRLVRKQRFIYRRQGALERTIAILANNRQEADHIYDRWRTWCCGSPGEVPGHQ